jgi:uncharacterized protein DUF4304
MSMHVADLFKADFRAQGYRKRGASYHRTHGTVTLIVNFQHSTSSKRAWKRFTINVGWFSQLLDGALTPSVEGMPPTEPHCQLRQRLGRLQQERDDLWWEIDLDNPDPALVAEIRQRLAEGVFPYLDRMKSETETLDVLRGMMEKPPRYPLTDDLLVLALLAKALGMADLLADTRAAIASLHHNHAHALDRIDDWQPRSAASSPAPMREAPQVPPLLSQQIRDATTEERRSELADLLNRLAASGPGPTTTTLVRDVLVPISRDHAALAWLQPRAQPHLKSLLDFAIKAPLLPPVKSRK